MKTNKLDNSIKEKLENRTFAPSASAWERLSTQLDEQPKQKKKGWFFYVGSAASIILLLSVGFLYLNKEEKRTPNIIVVENPVDTITIDTKIDQFINEIPAEKAIVKVGEVEEKLFEISNKKMIAKKNKSVIYKKEKPRKSIVIAYNKNNVINTVKEVSEVNPTKKETIKKEILKQNSNSSIKINSEDLLFAVTHSSLEAKEHYAKYNLTREEVLKTIKSELQKTNIKVSPNAILAEVERTIVEEDFENNFLKSLKKRVTDIATAIASRNN